MHLLQGDGDLTAQDIQMVLCSWGNKITVEEVRALMEASGADADGSGSIDFSEFVQV